MSHDEIKAWYAMRREAIHERISAHDVLRNNGVKLVYTGEREEQFSCPFHGKDSKPSARVFPSTPQSPSHAWCYVCRERWDVITLWQKYHGTEGFHKTLSAIEKHLGIKAPTIPEGAFDCDVGNAPRKEFDDLYEACERRLISEKHVFTLGEYLRLGSVLDRAMHQVSSGKLSYPDGTVVMRKVLAKIGEKVRGSNDV